jgi:predicted lipid-binding transport protein (Tim44 family)
MFHQELAWSLAAWRPGGGHTFSGGHFGGGNSGGGGGGGDLVILLFELVINYPAVGIPVTIAVVVFWVANNRIQKNRKEWHAGVDQPSAAVQAATWGAAAPVAPPQHNPRRELARLNQAPAGGQARPYDPDFSLVLFEDFVYALYARAEQARGRGTLDEFGPYLSPAARSQLRASPSHDRLVDVATVIIGAMTYVGVSGIAPGSSSVSVELEFESNYTEVSQLPNQQRADHAYYVVERWMLTRAATAHSRPPARSRTFDCPNCGAPLEAIRDNVCTYCHATVGTGQFDWLVTGVDLREKHERGPQLTGDTEERGTDFPTVFDPNLQANSAALTARDPAFNWQAFQARTALIFNELQVAWSSLEWQRIRPYVSDNLFQMLLFWIEAYKKAALRNVLENPQVTFIEIARVLSDKYYDAITVRVYAQSLDYTVDAKGKVVSGHRHTPRKYTEYWTLIRGTQKTGTAVATKNCPSCGAPLNINMAGQCQYCNARVTSGDFDWVLSQIEQDEAYQG